MGVPTLYVRLLAEAGFGREACRNMRLFIAGSAPLADRDLQRVPASAAATPSSSATA